MTHHKTLDQYIFEHWTDLGALAEDGPQGWTNDQYDRFYDLFSREIWDKLYDEYSEGICYNTTWACPANFCAWLSTLLASNDVEDRISFVKHVSKHALMVRASELMSIDPE